MACGSCGGGRVERQVITSNQAEAMIAAAAVADRYELADVPGGGEYRFTSYIAALHGKRQFGGRIIEIR